MIARWLDWISSVVVPRRAVNIRRRRQDRPARSEWRGPRASSAANGARRLEAGMVLDEGAVAHSGEPRFQAVVRRTKRAPARFPGRGVSD